MCNKRNSWSLGFVQIINGKLMRELRPVPADDVKNWWYLVRPSVEKVKARDVEKWLPEDVYMSLMTNQAFLHVFLTDGRYRGCLVTKVWKDFNGVCMHIWLSEGNDNIVKEYWPMIQDEARKIGANNITFCSARKGWERIHESMGLKRQSFYMGEV